MLKIVRPVSFVLLSAAFCSGGVVHASDRAAITPRVGISQQEGSLKGTVSDSFGPVAGASIVVKGTTNGTVTDMNGNFEKSVLFAVFRKNHFQILFYHVLITGIRMKNIPFCVFEIYSHTTLTTLLSKK